MTVFDELSSHRRVDPVSREHPAGFSSLVDLLRLRAAEQAAKRLFTFLDDGERESAHLTYGGLDRRARAIAARLQEADLQGCRALLIHPPGQSFIEAFFGCLYAGVVAVPSYPPRSGERLLRLASLLEDVRPAVVLTDSSLLPRMERVAQRLPAAAAVPLIATDALDDGLAEAWQAPRVGLDDLAFLQYTSGSTSEPKGVMVTHGSLLHNEAMILRAFGQTPESVVVGWLPLYHDMGLIGNVLQPLFAGASCVLMPPLAFLQRPVRWLSAISRYRGTTSGGPNFAYELCARKIGPAEREGLDLSCWQVAFSGAEPVRAQTLDLFARDFASCGFRREAFHPCYGLAEATLFVSGGTPGAGPVFTAVPHLLTGCGRPWDGQRIAVVDPGTCEERSPGEVGEIWVHGPSVAAGYWNRPELSAETFDARLGNGDGPFLRTGDLGFVQDGNLFVTGRIKDLIILRGRNHYPQDVELTVERSHPALRPGCGAAFAVEVDGAERLVVVQEIERNRRAEAPRAAEAARRAVAEEHEIRVHEVVVVLPGAVPKTTSGKVQRRACREAYLEGSLEPVHRGLAPEEAESPLEPALDRGALLVEQVGVEVARAVRANASAVPPGERLSDLGVDSLAAAELKHRLEELLEVEVPLEMLLEGPTVGELASRLAPLLEAGPRRLPRTGIDSADHPLSAGQKALWLTHELAPESGAFNLAGMAAAPPGLDTAALRRAWQALVDRHPALRTGFVRAESEPRQWVRPAVEVDFSEIETGDLEQEAYRPFDLERDRLLRVRVVRADDGWRILVVVHHLVADFWSFAVLLRELGALYTQETGGAAAALSPPGLPYSDWVRWQEEALSGDCLERLWEHWKQSLDGAPLALDLPADRPRPPVQGYGGGAVTLRLGEPLAARLREISRAGGATLYMILLAAFQTLLHRQTGQDDLVVGSPVSGRNASEWRDTVGYFVNPLVLRARFAEAPAFSDLLVQVRRTVLAAFAHQDLPFLLLAERLQPQRDPGRPALFQTLFVFQKAQGEGQEDLAAFSLGAGGSSFDLGALRLEPRLLQQRRAQVDLSLAMAELAGGGLAAAFEYAVDLFDEATIQRLAVQLETLLEAVAEEPWRSVAELAVLPAALRHQLLCEWNAIGESPRPECLHHLFEAQAERTPQAVAVEAGPATLTYAELDRQASDLAAHLRSLGIRPEERVGVHLDRSPDLVVALLGVLKAGGAYVPLDLGLPPARLDFMMADAGARVVLTRGGLLSDRPGIQRVLLPVPSGPPAARSEEARPENLAYLIYTSGSTGRPKGVAIEHRSAAVLVRWAREEFSAEETACVLASTSISFDLSVFELFVPLSCGGRIVLADDALRVPVDSGITLFNTVPSVMAELLRAGSLPASVRSVNLAGEPLPRTLVDELFACPGVEKVRNLYGPSEDTTYSTCGPAEREGERVPSIGRPIAATFACVLDSRLEPVPAGALGELFLGGSGLARGYWSRPGLTAERFVPDPFAEEPGARLYRTGDLVRHRPDGRLDYLGRIDHQVKLRGFRIELGEIEAALAENPGVREAVALVREDAPGDRRLVAYVVPAEGEAPSAPALRSWLSARLPASMVPSDFVPLAELPLTPNGKLDRRALPQPPAAVAGSVTAPRTPVEEVLAGLWSEVLGVEAVGIHDGFFDLGGHSLLAVRLASRVRSSLGVELPLREMFERPTVAQLAAWIEEARRQRLAPEIPPLEREPRNGPVPASFAQRRLWFLDQLEPGNPAYNIPLAVRLTGRLHAEVLAWSLSEVARRHEVLRTTFAAEAGEPVQVIGLPSQVPLPLTDLSALPPEDRRKLAQRLAGEEARHRFDLAQGPLLRASLLRLEEEEHLLLLGLHHTVADGWSLGVLLAEVSALYGARLRGEAPALPEPPVQYADHALWQRRWLQGDLLERQLVYWRRRLGDAPLALDLPADRPRPPVQTYRGARRSFSAPPELAAALSETSRRAHATPFMVLLAAFKAFLSRYTGQTDLCVGAPVAGRSGTETEGLIGLFVNTLVLRTDLSGEPAFSELVQRVRETSLSAYLHQDLPFERLVEELRTERSLAQSALFQVLFVLQNAPLPALELPGLTLFVEEVDPGAVKFDLSLEATLTQEGLAGRLAYNSDLFQATTAERLVRHFLSLLTDALAHPGRSTGDLALLDEAEREQLLRGWNAASLPEDLPSVQELFAFHAEREPGAPAVVAGDEVLSRGEVLARARQLAGRLRLLGVTPESTVALLAERSASTIVGLLAVLEAGGAYVPIDPDLPDERLAFLLEDARPVAALASSRIAGRLDGAGLPVVCLDEPHGPVEPAAVRPAGENLAYVIYTSGSTGRPKGVAVEHRQLAAYTRAVVERLELAGCASFAVVSTLAADLGHTSVFPALATGGCLHVISRGCAEDAEAFAAYFERHAVDALKIVPSHLAALQAVESPERGLPRKRLILGGEAASWEDVDRYLARAPECRVFNHYGPTETTVGVLTFAADQASERSFAGPPLGRPLPGAEVYVLDGGLRPVPPGAPGELLVGGAGVSRGYLGRPDLTAERFVPHPFALVPGARLYRTGDLARRRPDGNVEFLGRADRQVKVRGFRVELGEIAAALKRHPAIREAVAVADRQRLAAYLVGAGPELPSEPTLIAFLRELLPDYMVPAAFVWLDAIPLTANGKLDERALPDPWQREPEASRQPRTVTEEILSGIWSELLGLPQVGLDDDFFALGGHSLLATRLVSKVRQTFRVDVPLRALFEAPTAAALASRIDALRGVPGEVSSPIPRLPVHDGAPPSFAQERLWFLDQLDPGRPTYNLPYFARVAGPLDPDVLRRALDEVVRRHEALRTRFPAEDGRPVQRISPPRELALPSVDLSGLPADRREAEAERLARQEGERPFDLAAGPLLRCLLLRLEAADHTFLLNLHHIASDAWSRGILAREVALLYEAFRAGEPSPLPELSIQYADFAAWQREWIPREVLPRELPYWLERLGADLPPLQLPADRPRPASRSGLGGLEAFALSASLTERLRALARREGVSLFMVLLSGFGIQLRRYSGQSDIVVGSPIANRNRADLEPLIGFFANTLALRLDLGDAPTFAGMVARVRETALGAYDHQDLPFERLVEAVAGSREVNRGPLFEVVFLLQNAPMPRLEFGSLAWRPFDVHNGTAKFDLTLSLTEVGDGLSGTLVYDADLYDAATARRMLRHFETLLDAAVADPMTSVERLPLMPPGERRQLLAESRTAGPEKAQGLWVHERFDLQVESDPRAVALVSAEESLSYRELRSRADRLSGWLAAQGIGPGATVGICLRHGPPMVVAVLGVLKAGAAYVPMDPGHPPSRLSFMATDADLSLWLSDRELSPLLPRGEVPLLDLESDWERVEQAGHECPPVRVSGEDAAYIIYTSGSTGKPKGVSVPHASLLNYVLWAAESYLRGPALGVALYSSLSFDLTVTSIYPPLLTGGTIRIFRDPGRGAVLEEIFRGGEVDVVKLTPSHLALIRDLDNRGSRVRRLVVGGEALERDLAEQVLESFGGSVEIYNEYGPTEATVGCMIHLFDPARDRRAAVPIGRPAAATGIYVLDEHFEPVPPNVVGELCIAGRGLARGYHRRPDLTGSAFVPSPFGVGERLYRSGDLARRLPDGILEFLGRRDEQVKFHGFRVELDEIRGALNRHRDVRDSIVQVRKDPHGNDVLVAYYVSRRELDVTELRAFLAGALQDEMIPNLFVHLRKLPLTLNGKVNFQALPGVEEIRSKLATTESRKVSRPAEEILEGIWSEVLGVPRIGLRDNFFELGGHSLLGTQVVSRVREAFGVDLPLRSLFEQPTVEELAQRIEEEIGAGRKAAAPPIEAVPRNGGLPLSFAQHRLLFLERLQPGSALYNVPGALRVEGTLDLGALQRSLNGLVRRHETLRTRFADLGGETVQVIDEPGKADLAAVDLSNLTPDLRSQEIERLASEEARRPFLLAAAAPLRVRVLRCSPTEHLVLLTMHHIASDGWSMGVLMREIGVLYQAASAGRPSPLPELPVQYADFACWQRRWLGDEGIEGQLAYWLRHLEDAPPLFDLPTDRPRPPVQSYRGAVLSWEVPAGLRSRLEALTRREGATLFMVLLAGFQVLLRWYSGREDFVVGTDVANRNRLETEGLIGFFVNQLPLRARLAGLTTFREVLAQAREATLGAYLHQDAPFEKVVEALRLERSLAYSPLLQVKINLHNFRIPTLTLPGLSFSPVELPTGTAKLDLQFDVFDGPEELVGSCQYRTDLFDADTIRRLLRLFGTLLERVTEEAAVELAELTQLLDSVERVEDGLARDRFRASRSATLRSRIRKPVEPKPLQGG